MRILGLDPGTATVGYGIIEERGRQLELITHGVIATSANDGGAARRLQLVYDALAGLLERYRPDAAAIEELFFGRNITTAIAVGQARGVLLLALANAGIPIGEYSPPQIKQAVTGAGNAAKQQVQFMVKTILELDETPQPDDAADGLAVAITHYQQLQTARLQQGE
jgi:crossover junction endodeoxyribonuclease RuvC